MQLIDTKPSTDDGSSSKEAGFTLSIKDYRPFIDGLRAVAVCSVVAYHAGIPGISGGYVGVDIFFVISGFLIINQIVYGLGKGNFSFADFWSRRAIRILPTYLLVIVSSIVIGLFVLVEPSEFESFGQEVMWSAGMVVNHLFLSQEGYFDTAADTKPLLHLWSLAVEEQFYIFAPLFLAGIWLLGSRKRAGLWFLGAVLFGTSLIGSILLTEGEKNYSFYLMVLRAWQFIAGGAIALFIGWFSTRRLLSEALGLAGLAAIVVSIALFTHDTVFPGYAALLPTFGACAVIIAGCSNQRTLVAYVLALKPLVWIGLVSYAFYLWHWPLLVFGRMYMFESPSLAANVGFSLVALVLATYTYLFIEKPLKAWRRSVSFNWHGWKPAMVGFGGIAQVAIAGLLLTTAVAPTLALSWPFEKWQPEQQAKVRGRHLGILIGDSHASTALAGIDAVLKQFSAAVLPVTSGGCPPLLEATIFRKSGIKVNCGRREATLRNAERRGADFAILIARWNIYVPTETIQGNDTRRLIGGRRPDKDQHAAFVSHLKKSIKSLRRRGFQRILIVAPTPEFDRHPLRCVPRTHSYGADPALVCGEALERVIKRRAMAMASIKQASEGFADIRIADPLSAFCANGVCSPATKTKILWRDRDHLSPHGVRILATALRKDLAWVSGN